MLLLEFQVLAEKIATCGNCQKHVSNPKKLLKRLRNQLAQIEEEFINNGEGMTDDDSDSDDDADMKTASKAAPQAAHKEAPKAAAAESSDSDSSDSDRCFPSSRPPSSSRDPHPTVRGSSPSMARRTRAPSGSTR